MKVIDEGHVYELEALEKGKKQTIRFVKKVLIEGTKDLETVHDGTTNEEVLDMLIHRLIHLHGILPDDRTNAAIEYLRKARVEIKNRTSERAMRGVAGTLKP